MQNTDDCQERMQALGRSRPLAFTTAKSRLGHAETGAGVLGMLHAWRQLSQGTTHSITHLRSVNPYVASTLEGSRGAAALLPRQPAPALTASRDVDELHAGVSSFAFQVSSASAPETA